MNCNLTGSYSEIQEMADFMCKVSFKTFFCKNQENIETFKIDSQIIFAFHEKMKIETKNDTLIYQFKQLVT